VENFFPFPASIEKEDENLPRPSAGEKHGFEAAIMSEKDVREVSRIRQELRDRLMAERHEGVGDVLAVLRRLAERDIQATDLRKEYERWALRFYLLERVMAP